MMPDCNEVLQQRELCDLNVVCHHARHVIATQINVTPLTSFYAAVCMLSDSLTNVSPANDILSHTISDTILMPAH